MHTVLKKLDPGSTLNYSYSVVHQKNLGSTIAQFHLVDEAAHFCNRLNGGCSGELAALVLLLREQVEKA